MENLVDPCFPWFEKLTRQSDLPQRPVIFEEFHAALHDYHLVTLRGENQGPVTSTAHPEHFLPVRTLTGCVRRAAQLAYIAFVVIVGDVHLTFFEIAK
jgi:hypothetical protein